MRCGERKLVKRRRGGDGSLDWSGRPDLYTFTAVRMSNVSAAAVPPGLPGRAQPEVLLRITTLGNSACFCILVSSSPAPRDRNALMHLLVLLLLLRAARRWSHSPNGVTASVGRRRVAVLRRRWALCFRAQTCFRTGPLALFLCSSAPRHKQTSRCRTAMMLTNSFALVRYMTLEGKVRGTGYSWS